MSVFSSFWLGLFTCVILLHVVSGLQCAACVDGKVAHNPHLFQRFRVPAKGQYPPCNHDYGKMRKITTVECKSSCLAAEIVNRGVYTAITRFCADKVFFDNSTYRDNRMFQTVPAPDPNLVNYEISSRVCKTDLCNLDKIPSYLKPTTAAPPFFRFEKIIGENAGTALAIPLAFLALYLVY